MLAYSMLFARRPVAGVSGKHLTTAAIEPKSSDGAVGDELVRIEFYSDRSSAFTLNERDRLVRSFLPSIEGTGKRCLIRHDGEVASIVVARDPKDADAVCTTELSH